MFSCSGVDLPDIAGRSNLVLWESHAPILCEYGIAVRTAQEFIDLSVFAASRDAMLGIS
jgi:hypothetical protein